MVFEKNKIVFILPYFGKFNSLFPVWLKSCEWNKDIDWLIFSDNRISFKTAPNIRFINISFSEIKNLIEKTVDLKIVLNKAYRLCNFRPAHGDIFKEYITNYDWWGYCDCDLIWGKLSDFISKMPDDCFQFGRFGHCTFVPNNDFSRKLYKYSYAYKLVFTTDDTLFFDEIGFREIASVNHLKIYEEFPLGDFNPRKKAFSPVWNCGVSADVPTAQLFTADKEGLTRWYLKDGEVKSNPIAYIHFLKRKMNIFSNLNLDERLLITPNSITNYHDQITREMIADSANNGIYWDYWKNGLTPKMILKKIRARLDISHKRNMKAIHDKIIMYNNKTHCADSQPEASNRKE